MKQYVVDAFTDTVFHGNQAAIIITESWPSDELMMQITKENCFADTAFCVKEDDKYRIRWFTPGGEIDLCGHCTLGAAFILFKYYEQDADVLKFTSHSGELTVIKRGDMLEMEFPSYHLERVEVTDAMEQALGVRPLEVYKARDYLFILDSEDTVKSLKPDFRKIKEFDALLVHVSAKGTKEDCVSRSFGARMLIEEDPVCGSGHCHIIPYWADVLGKKELVALQASERGGTLYCRFEGDRVFMAGKAVIYSIDELFI